MLEQPKSVEFELKFPYVLCIFEMKFDSFFLAVAGIYLRVRGGGAKGERPSQFGVLFVFFFCLSS